MGYDVWIGCTRGRAETSTHTTLNLADPVDEWAYWDFSFEEIGNEDVSSMIDKIIATRVNSCTKVAVVTHSTAANSAIVLATNADKQLSQKVSQIVTLAPCLQVNLLNFWNDLRDL